MVRYSQLLAGASWVGEYGDPKDASMRDYLLSYSPYHNVSADKRYPELFLLTSTKDDRGHPGHARKFAAKMMNLGHKNVHYYENTEGGHAATANLQQKARMRALTYEFLFQTIH
jgi:prolyl oligopeptidase